MAWNFRQAGTKAAMTTGVNALTPSSHPGQSDQLSRVQAFIATEIATFGSQKVVVSASGHYDANGSSIHISIQPAKTNSSGEVISLP